MDNISTIILAIFASTGFWTFLSTMITNRSKKKSAEQVLLIGLARGEIIRQGNELIERGEISCQEYKDFEDFCNAYLVLGGNGGGKAKYDEVTHAVRIK